MKFKEYPRFKRGEGIKVFNALSKKEQKIILDFVGYVSISSSSEKRLENNKRSITQFRNVVSKPFDKLTLEDLRNYLALLNKSDITRSSQNELKASIKRFLKWHFKDWSDRFQNLSDIKLRFGINEEKINAQTIPKKEEIERLVNAEKRLMWKTYLITSYESGLRPIELRTITWDRISEEKGEITSLKVYSTKTKKSRVTYVKEATKYLRKLRQVSAGDTPLVFPSPKDKNEPLKKDLVSWWLTKLSKDILGRKITPYMLRHARATELYTNADIPDSIVKKFLGHSLDMRDVYTHLSTTDVKDAMAKSVYSFEDLDEEKKHELKLEIEELRKNSVSKDDIMKLVQQALKKTIETN
ncbi:tyrosine-type recombinase/integrase [archaeon]|jgi:integrase|nr:tyrosine-type recombinase/integrase [archaeon]MBT7661054.1 tyrosine-type recombinase/integrase [archaeon]